MTAVLNVSDHMQALVVAVWFAVVLVVALVWDAWNRGRP